MITKLRGKRIITKLHLPFLSSRELAPIPLKPQTLPHSHIHISFVARLAFESFILGAPLCAQLYFSLFICSMSVQLLHQPKNPEAQEENFSAPTYSDILRSSPGTAMKSMTFSCKSIICHCKTPKVPLRPELTVHAWILALLQVRRDIYSWTKWHLEHFGKKCIVDHCRDPNIVNFHFECFWFNFRWQIQLSSFSKRREYILREAQGFRDSPGISLALSNHPVGT